MLRPYVKIKRFGFSGSTDMLVWGNGTEEWCKNLSEFTSWISVTKEPIKFKQTFCENISEDLNAPFTIEDLDRIITKKDYAKGKILLAEYTHIVETNIKCVEQGKEPFYLGTSIAGDIIIKHLLKERKHAK